jgi:hypothetical protein
LIHSRGTSYQTCLRAFHDFLFIPVLRCARLKMVADSPHGRPFDEGLAAGRLKIILGIDYGTTFTGKSPGSRIHQPP